jgi:hypothetical protein
MTKLLKVYVDNYNLASRKRKDLNEEASKLRAKQSSETQQQELK